MLLHMLLSLIAFSVSEAATYGSVDIDGIGEVFVVAPDWAGPYLEVFFDKFIYFFAGGWAGIQNNLCTFSVEKKVG